MPWVQWVRGGMCEGEVHATTCIPVAPVPESRQEGTHMHVDLHACATARQARHRRWCWRWRGLVLAGVGKSVPVGRGGVERRRRDDP
jgi:hypothetical protein